MGLPLLLPPPSIPTSIPIPLYFSPLLQRLPLTKDPQFHSAGDREVKLIGEPGPLPTRAAGSTNRSNFDNNSPGL